MTTNYEWLIEELDGPGEDADIIDVNHAETLRDARRMAEGLTHVRLGLVRDTDDDRAWAYFDANGTLPLQMLDAYDRPVCAVPLSYRYEAARHNP